MQTPLWAMMIFVLVSFFSTLGTFFIKKASATITLNIKKNFKNKNLILGIFIYCFSVVISIPALRSGELSVLYPFAALQYVWTAILSRNYLKEQINILRWIGICLIFLGVSLAGIFA